MKCTNYIATESIGKKGKTRLVTMRPDWFDKPNYREYRKLIPITEGVFWSPCPGTIKIDITASDTPDYHSDHYAELSIAIICSHCGRHMGTGLGMPDQFTLTEWVNALMDQIDVMPFKDTKTASDEMMDVKNALTAKIMAEENIQDPNVERVQRNAHAKACLQIMKFNEKRMLAKEPHWDRLDLETAKAAGLL